METKLTKLQAYNSMIKFLDIRYERTKSDDVGSLLDKVSPLSDNKAADLASWKEWITCVDDTLKEHENHRPLLTFESTDKKL